MRRVLILCAVAWLCQGCFVFDEIDAGMELMEQHSPKKNEPKEPTRIAASSAAEEEPGFVERLREWYDARREAPPPERDPDDGVVRCNMRGVSKFMRKSECLLQGGDPL